MQISLIVKQPCILKFTPTTIEAGGEVVTLCEGKHVTVGEGSFMGPLFYLDLEITAPCHVAFNPAADCTHVVSTVFADSLRHEDLLRLSPPGSPTRPPPIMRRQRGLW